MLDIDTAIKHCEEVAVKLEEKANIYGIKETYIPDSRNLADCMSCAAEHRQLAEWLTELKEAKRLLKSATNVLKRFKPCDGDYDCSECIHQRQNCDYDDRFEWRYADEALKLIGETNDEP
jgi:hypothetical protein